MFNLFSSTLGIDLGTAYTLVYQKGKGIVLRIPSVVAYDKERKEVIAIGEEAKLMYGKTPEGIIAVKPIKDGVIENLELVQEFLHRIIKRFSGFFSPVLVVGVPSSANEVEKKAVIDAGLGAGARDVYLVYEPIASAIGIGLDVSKSKGYMIVDIGGGTTEIAIISLSQIAHQNSIKVAGDEMDEAIMEYIRRKYNISIGYLTAEEIKIKIGSAYPQETEEYMEISGWDVIQHRTKTFKISSSEVREALNGPINQIINAISRLFENSKADLLRDVLENGIYLTGGGSLIKGLDLRIKEELNIVVNRVDYPLETVGRGIGKIVDDFNKYKPLLSKGKKILKSR
ncbi:MAG: rod shape-determining protein [candidate division WOR-3 bacterium]|nr:rod shape-determining protein [candidate division WOR-3 bacterium]MCX7948371.1 rod shape-determining protein [candidate division WOR-3 bacterium]MDW8151271.1 rod shape-determining protein [candidate division WOR-3 bacterium]